MAPSEASILSNFLLPPAPLPAAISLRQFTDLFPSAQRQDPQVGVLYRELQHQRAMDTDDVKRNIATEVKRGEAQRREVTRARRREGTKSMEGIDRRELQMDVELFGPSASAPPRQEHTLKTILPDMDQAKLDMEAEITALENESEELLSQIRDTVGDLSDLRYGRFNRGSAVGKELGEEVIDSLTVLEKLAGQAGKG